MNDLDSQLIFEAYNEEVIDEGLKDVAKKAAQYGAIGAAAAGSAFGSPQAKATSAAEPPAITQTHKASQDIGDPEFGGVKKGETFDDYLERQQKKQPDNSGKSMDEIASQSMQQALKSTKGLLDGIGKTLEDMEASEPERKQLSQDFDDLLKQAQELFKKTDATKKRR